MPSRSNPGDVVTVTARLESKADTPMSRARLTLVGLERTSQRAEYQFVALAADFGPQKLTVGQHDLTARFQLPPDGPPTHAGLLSRVTYEVRVEVEIPWWRNVDRTFEIIVVAPPVEPPSAKTVFTSRRGDAEGEVYAEMSLASTVIAPGTPIRGAVSFNQVASGKHTRVEAAFVGVEGLAGEVETMQFGARIHDGPLVEGEPIPFAITLPKTAPTSLQARRSRMAWFFDVAISDGWGKKPLMRVPIQVWPTTREGGSGRLALVGKSRRAQLWASVGAEVGLEYDADADRLRTRRHDVGVEVSTAPRADGKAFLTARLTYTPLCMELSVAPRRLFTALLTEGVAVDALFDKGFFVTARDAAQTKILLADIGDLFDGLAEVRMNDAELTLAHAGSGVDRAALKRFLGLVARAHSILGRNLSKVPLPSSLVPREPAMRALASRLGGVLHRPSASIQGAERHGQRVTVFFEPGPDAPTLRVEVARPSNPPTKEPSKRAAAAKEALAAAGALDVRRDAIHFTPAGGVPDALEKVEEHVDAVVTLSLLLEGQGDGGPYR